MTIILEDGKLNNIFLTLGYKINEVFIDLEIIDTFNNVTKVIEGLEDLSPNKLLYSHFELETVSKNLEDLDEHKVHLILNKKYEYRIKENGNIIGAGYLLNVENINI